MTTDRPRKRKLVLIPWDQVPAILEKEEMEKKPKEQCQPKKHMKLEEEVSDNEEQEQEQEQESLQHRPDEHQEEQEQQQHFQYRDIGVVKCNWDGDDDELYVPRVAPPRPSKKRVIVDSDDDDVMPPGCDIDYDDMLLMPRSMADNEPCRHPKKPRKEESFKKPKEQHQPVFFKQSNSVTLKQQQESFQQKKQEQPRPVSLKQPKKQETVPPKHPKKQEPVLQSVSNKQPVLMPRRYEEDVYVENMEKYPAVEYLKPFQVEALEKIREMPVSFVTWAPGSGKTILAIRVAVDCLEKKLVKQVTVIAPLSLHGNIFRSMEQFKVPKVYQSRFQCFTPQKFRRIFAEDRKVVKSHMVIVDEAHSVRTDIQEGLSAKIRNRRKNGKEILLSSTLLTAIRQSADVNVIPLGKEHHWMISDSMAVIEACRKAYKVLFLSGTPLVNNPFDIANFLSLAEGTPIAKKREFIEDIMDRVDDVKQYFLFHEDNKEGFPKVNETTWEIEVDDKTYPMICKAKEQNEMFEKEVFYVGDRMCSNAGVPFKVNAIKDYIESGDRKPGKMLIHSAFKANGLKTVGDMLRALGLKYVVISGDENEQERTDNFLQFCDPNSGVDICLTSPAGGQGLDFRGIRTIFITEAQWNQATKNQIIGRGARRGSHDHLPLEDRTLDVYQLVLKYPGESLSADQCIAQHTEKKHNICSALLNKLKC